MYSSTFFLSLATLSLSFLAGIAAEDVRTWCDPILGCLELTPEWYTASRPLNVLPYTRERINTGFILQTKENPGYDDDTYIYADDLSTITTSTFNPNRPTKFAIHGFMDDGGKKWLKDFTASILGHGDYNVIRVDWGGGSKFDYLHAMANIRVVGLEISHLVNNLIELYGLDPTTVHLIGHSLGAHASGYAGEGIENMGRITGMDPAGPGFTDTSTIVHLDPTDANFVDIIHSDSNSIYLTGLGTAMPMGHLDFFPNGGHQMPGCGTMEVGGFWNWVNGPRDVVACNHQRSVNYFEESLYGNTCPWLAQECADYDSFKNGLCTSCGEDNSGCAYMGINADQYATPERQNVHLYIDTNDMPLFCRVHYVLEILTDLHDDAEKTVVGNFRITLYGADGGILDMGRITEKHEKIDHGTLVRYMFITEEEIGNALTVELEWNYNDTLNPGTYCSLFCNRSIYVKSIQVSPLSVYPQTARSAATFTGCSPNGETTEMKDGKVVTFMQSQDCAAVADPVV